MSNNGKKEVRNHRSIAIIPSTIRFWLLPKCTAPSVSVDVRASRVTRNEGRNDSDVTVGEGVFLALSSLLLSLLLLLLSLLLLLLLLSLLLFWLLLLSLLLLSLLSLLFSTLESEVPEFSAEFW